MSGTRYKSPRLMRLALIAGASLACAAVSQQAQASESGTSFYLLGSGGPGAAELPPVEGVFLVNTAFYYNGSAGGSRELVIGGNVASNIDGTVIADFPTLLAVPTTNFAGGILALGLTLPMGEVDVDAGAVLTGPHGGTRALNANDSAFIMGDPVLMGTASWKSGNLHYALSGMVNVPIGDYRERQLANLSFNRWAGDVSAAATWLDREAGWDVSGKVGVTFNGENSFTNYETGTEFHAEAAVEKKFSPAFSAGLQGYYFKQLTGDSGSGAVLGDFKGEVTGLGGTAAYNFKIGGKIPASVRLRGLTEFNVTNRLKGTSVFLEFAMPLAVRMPAGAAHD